MGDVGTGSPLSPRAFAFAAGAFWGGIVLVIGLIGWWCPGYQSGIADMLRLMYPLRGEAVSPGNILAAAGAAALHGAITGGVLAWFYNLSLKCPITKKIVELTSKK